MNFLFTRTIMKWNTRGFKDTNRKSYWNVKWVLESSVVFLKRSFFLFFFLARILSTNKERIILLPIRFTSSLLQWRGNFSISKFGLVFCNYLSILRFFIQLIQRKLARINYSLKFFEVYSRLREIINFVKDEVCHKIYSITRPLRLFIVTLKFRWWLRKF